MSYIIQLAIYYYYFGDHGSVTTARQHFQLDNITIIGEVHDKSGGSGSSVNMEAAKLLSRFFCISNICKQSCVSRTRTTYLYFPRDQGKV